jgi:inward rectifier potassium channel
MTTTPPPQDDINKDLGLGSRVSQQSQKRFLNRDGTFNVGRKGIPFFQSLNVYHWMLSISWLHFYFIVGAFYFATNIFFASAYLLSGPEALRGASGATLTDRFLEAFFFSVQTLATIGYGTMSPNGLAANILVTVEALVGLLGFALATGLLFARFSRPSAKIIFSRNAIIAPYKGITAFEFRIANGRSNQLIEVEATVTFSRIEPEDGKNIRKFSQLTLERKKVVFLPLHWVIVHPIDDNSPLKGVTEENFNASDAEILISLTGIDETFSQTVHARSSYKHHEVVWDVRFADMFLPDDDGMLNIDLRKIHEIEKVPSG